MERRQETHLKSPVYLRVCVCFTAIHQLLGRQPPHNYFIPVNLVEFTFPPQTENCLMAYVYEINTWPWLAKTDNQIATKKTN